MKREEAVQGLSGMVENLRKREEVLKNYVNSYEALYKTSNLPKPESKDINSLKYILSCYTNLLRNAEALNRAWEIEFEDICPDPVDIDYDDLRWIFVSKLNFIINSGKYSIQELAREWGVNSSTITDNWRTGMMPCQTNLFKVFSTYDECKEEFGGKK